MRLVLDAGALIAIDCSDRYVANLIKLGQRGGADLVTTAPAVGQAWRDGARQARLARALTSIDVHQVDLDTAKAAGILLAKAGTADVVDALVALLALPGDQILTSDPDDLTRLASAAGTPALVVAV